MSYLFIQAEMKPTEDPVEEMNSIDDDLFSLLDNFPEAMPAPDWYGGGRDLSRGKSSGVASDSMRLDTQQSASTAPVISTNSTEHEWGGAATLCSGITCLAYAK